MKAALLEDLNKLTLAEVPTPEIGDDDALLRVEATSVCGSDVRIYHHGNPRVKPPTIIGHETAGVVVAAGKNVTRVKVGQRVAIGADVPCGQCHWCRNGLGNNCTINYAVGYQIPGAFAEFMKLPKLLLEEGPVVPFSDKLSFEEAALAEPLGCAINGLELIQMSLGKTLVIFGLGPIGCMMIDLGRLMGATKIIAIQRSKGRLELAKQHYNADVFICSGEEDAVQRVLEETDGEGAEAIVTTSGSVEVHEQAIEMVSHRGWVNLFGGLGKDARPMNLLSNKIHYKECFLTGSHGCVPRQHETAVRLIERGLVRVKPLITQRYLLDDIHQAFDTHESRKGMKISVFPNGIPTA